MNEIMNTIAISLLRKREIEFDTVHDVTYEASMILHQHEQTGAGFLCIKYTNAKKLEAIKESEKDRNFLSNVFSPTEIPPDELFVEKFSTHEILMDLIMHSHGG